MKRTGYQLIAAKAFVLLLARCCAVPRAGQVSDDLDSLVYMADQVVEGHIIAANGDSLVVRVSAVYSGNRTVGSNVEVLETGLYEVPRKVSWRAGSLEVGDQVFLFLRPFVAHGNFEIWTDSRWYVPLGLGIKFADRGRVCDLSSSKYVAFVTDRVPTTPSVGSLRDALQASVIRTSKWTSHTQQVIYETGSSSLTFSASTASPAWPSFPSPYPWRDYLREGSAAVFAAAVLFFLIRFSVRRQRSRTRYRNRLCTHCGYDLRATAKKCPECGTETPEFIQVRVLRSRACSVVFGMLLIGILAIAALWVRSHRISDCWTRTAMERADSVYTTRGVAVIQQFVQRGSSSWTHDAENPADMPRSAEDVGGSADWRFVGLEYAPAVRLIAIPFWQLTVGMVLLTAISVVVRRRLRPIRIFPGYSR